MSHKEEKRFDIMMVKKLRELKHFWVMQMARWGKYECILEPNQQNKWNWVKIVSYCNK